MKKISRVLIIDSFLSRGQQHIMAVETFLAFRRAFEFTKVTVLAVIYGGSVGAVCHVFVSGRTVTVHTVLSFMDVLAVAEFYNFFLDDIPVVENNLMTVKTSL
jgi:hypothetical protein